MKLPLTFHCGAICASCVLLPHTLNLVLGQTCYYPNGDVSTSDYPCSSEGDGLCCPFQWQCLSNGLCYLENADYYGRYTCTDKSWQSSSCPQLCTDGNTDFGDQAVLQCSGQDNNWCCDHNRNVSNVCCDSTDTSDFFPLAQGSSVASISTQGPAAGSPTINGVPPDNGGQSTTSDQSTSTSAAASSTSTSTSASTTSASTSTSTSTTTSSTKATRSSTTNQSPTSLVSIVSVVSIVTAGGSLITTTSALIPTVSPISSPAPSSNHHGAEIGGGVAGGIVLIALIALAFCLLRRRKSRQRYQPTPTTEHRNSMDYMYKSNVMGSPDTAQTSSEMDGTPIVGVYRGWTPTGGPEGALRVVNGSDRQSLASTTHTGTPATVRDSVVSELETPAMTPARAGFRGHQPTIEEQAYELPVPGEGGR